MLVVGEGVVGWLPIFFLEKLVKPVCLGGL
jgi:hypothetical protein